MRVHCQLPPVFTIEWVNGIAYKLWCVSVCVVIFRENVKIFFIVTLTFHTKRMTACKSWSKNKKQISNSVVLNNEMKMDLITSLLRGLQVRERSLLCHSLSLGVSDFTELVNSKTIITLYTITDWGTWVIGFAKQHIYICHSTTHEIYKGINNSTEYSQFTTSSPPTLPSSGASTWILEGKRVEGSEFCRVWEHTHMWFIAIVLM